MKILVVGAGGIGSFFCRELKECIDQGYFLKPLDVTIADDDMVEVEQIMYQNFEMKDVGLNKALAIGYKYGFKVVKERISETNTFGGFDVVILCVDNDKTRKFVYESCFKQKKEFIDIRCSGRKVFVMPKAMTLNNNLKYIDADDENNYSCQEGTSHQIGNRIASEIGVQFLINLVRGHNNRIINIMV